MEGNGGQMERNRIADDCAINSVLGTVQPGRRTQHKIGLRFLKGLDSAQ